MAVGFTGFTVKLIINIGLFTSVSYHATSHQPNHVGAHPSAQNKLFKELAKGLSSIFSWTTH
jgi:hypothetical protein